MHAGCNSLLLAGAIDDSRVLLVERNLIGSTESLQAGILDLHTLVGRYYGSARERCYILQNLLATVAKAGSFASCNLQRATQLIDNQCRQSLTIDILGDNKQRTSALCYGLQDTHNLLHRRYLLIRNQDIGFVELRLHLLGVGDEVCRDVATVELHTLNHIYVSLGTLCLLDGDYTLVIYLCHSLGNELTNLLIVVCRDCRHLLNLIEVRAYNLALLLQRLHNLLNRSVDTALQVHGVCTGSHILDAHRDKRLRKNRSRSCAITGIVVGLRRHLTHHLRTHVGERILQLHLLGYRNTILGNLRRTKLLVDNHVATLGAKCHLHSVAQRINTIFEKLASLYIISNLLCHNLC